MTDPLSPVAGVFPVDPLVTPPGEGFPGWSRRLVEVVRRSWRSIVAIALLTYGIPGAVFEALFRVAASRVLVERAGRPDSVRIDTDALRPIIFLGLFAIVVAWYLVAVGQAAVIYAVTREATGVRVGLGEALRYGLRAGIRLWGWSLLYGVMVLAGLCACFLPGLYLALAGCLYVPLAIFEPDISPISASFAMVNRGFVPALGRMALVAFVVWLVQFVLGVPGTLIGGSSALGVTVSAIGDLVGAPVVAAVPVAALLLYAELRARTWPTGTADLAAAL